ncbi:Hsp70 family protein [Vibrio sp. LaRot3]|uniref:Hsp70 family protein n=1 Tax=Vibrio sp. LaRot3 TaxID=2998829 RepID=UPI0022CE07C1|nr:Hsp70 family protein [Vibrio sp. LaRot3]MDA0147785.1 Hsp70 family protein [Vibrio sp. LaRot3]
MNDINTIQPLAIGIDLGTTNSAIAVWQGDSVEFVPNSLGKYLTPSVVAIDENDALLVGEAAKSRLVTQPLSSVGSFKRYLGTNRKFKLSKKEYSAVELCSLILSSLKQDAEAHLSQLIQDVVISVPAYFNDTQRKEVKAAAQLAGLNAVRLINEPTAACLSYSLHKQSQSRFLVFDLGGGTFDVTVVENADSFIEVRASTGDNFLGGDDFTEDLIHAVLDKLDQSLEELPLAFLSSLRSSCEVAKHRYNDGVTVDVPEPFAQSMSFNKPEMDKIWENSLSRIVRPLKQSLTDARLESKQIDELIFVGGSTRLKVVQQAANRLLGRFGHSEIDPDLVVAQGAAIQAACRLRNEHVSEIILTDVCPYSLGIKCVRGDRDGVFSPIIDRNTVIPVSRVETFSTCYDDQSEIRIAIYQGERLWAKDNIFIDGFDVEVPKGKAGQELIDVRFSYDINGLLEVDVTPKSTGETVSKVIDKSPEGISQEQIAASQDKLSQLKFHPRESVPNITLQEKLHQLYAENTAELRGVIEQFIFSFESVLDSQNEREIREHRTEIYQQLDRLGFK